MLFQELLHLSMTRNKKEKERGSNNQRKRDSGGTTN